MAGVRHFNRGLATVDDSAHQSLEVITGPASGFNDLGQGQFAGIGQGPHGGGAHAGAAVGQHRLGQLVHQLPKGSTLLVSHLAGLGWQVTGLQAGRLRSLFDLLEPGLVGAFAIRPVADDRFEASLSDGRHVGGRDLRGNRQHGGQ